MAKSKITAQAMQAAQLMADGHKIKDIITAIWGCTYEGDRAAWQRGRRQLAKWQSDPAWMAHYQELVRASITPLVGRAINRIDQQIDDSNPWIAQGAAREVLSRFGARAMGEEDKSVTVRVEGMPTLGVPGADPEA